RSLSSISSAIRASSSTTRTRTPCGKAMLASLMCSPQWHDNGRDRTQPRRTAAELEVPIDLSSERSDQTKAEGSVGSDGRGLGQPDTVIANGQNALPVRAAPEHEANRSAARAREGMLERVGDQFIEDQSAGNGRFDVHLQLLEIGIELDPIRR